MSMYIVHGVNTHTQLTLPGVFIDFTVTCIQIEHVPLQNLNTHHKDAIRFDRHDEIVP